MKLTVRHQIRIGMGDSPGRAVAHLLLTPKTGPLQSVGAWSVELPAGAEVVAFPDAFGNRAQMVTQARPEASWTITATGAVETKEGSGVLGRLIGEPVQRLFLRQTAQTKPYAAHAAKIATAEVRKDRIGLLHALMASAPDTLRQVLRAAEQEAPGDADGEAAGEQSQSAGGQSQKQGAPPPAVRLSPSELAHTFLGTARALGFPARYVTGYLASEGEQATTMHAWAEAYDDGLGWIAFDPSLQLCPAELHVRVACGLDAAGTLPVRTHPEPGVAPAVRITVVAE